MEPFDSIEKLINERGSASVLRERLLLAADKYAALEKQVAELQTKAAELEAKRENLQLQLEQSQTENQRLTEQSEQGDGNNPDRSDVENRILIFLGSGQNSTEHDIARHLGASIEVTRYHLVELDNASLVWAQSYFNRPAQWKLAQKGRGHLIRRGLLH